LIAGAKKEVNGRVESLRQESAAVVKTLRREEVKKRKVEVEEKRSNQWGEAKMVKWGGKYRWGSHRGKRTAGEGVIPFHQSENIEERKEAENPERWGRKGARGTNKKGTAHFL